MKPNKTNVILFSLAVCLLAAAWFLGGKAPNAPLGSDGFAPSADQQQPQQTEPPAPTLSPQPAPTPTPAPPVQQAQLPQTPTPQAQPPAKPTCLLTVNCATILQNMHLLEQGKQPLVPADGIIFSANVSFSEGETVLDVLLREMRQNGIHMDFAQTPGTGAGYVKGIANLYEFDCGAMSGWLFRVNGAVSGMASNQHPLKDGDVVEWLYTCNQGRDIE